MRTDVRENWTWADKHLPQVKNILLNCAKHILRIEVAPLEDDMKHATDMVITVKGGDIAVRVRRPHYDFRDLTIRAKAGGKTEIDKLREGFGRWYLYGWSRGGGRMSEWMLVDLDAVREAGLLDGRQIINNTDGRTGFIAIPATELMEHKCIAAHHLPRLLEHERTA